MAQHWIYHPNYDAVIVSDKEYEQLLTQGWYDTPAKFPKIEDVHVMTVEDLPTLGHGSMPRDEFEKDCKETGIRKVGRPPKEKADGNVNRDN